MIARAALALLLCCAPALRGQKAAVGDDVLLRALLDEVDRSRGLMIPGLDPLYLAEYSLEDADSFNAAATLGAIMSSGHIPVRALDVKVRVGSYAFDNSNFVLSGYSAGGAFEATPLPLDDNYLAARHSLWLATDRAFKIAEEAIGRKRSALKNVNVPDPPPDFARVSPVQSILPVPRAPVDEDLWRERLRELSAIFTAFPRIEASLVDMQASRGANYLVSSEGMRLRQPDGLAFIRARASAQAADGTALHDAAVFQASDLFGLPAQAAMEQGVKAMADNLAALADAPPAEAYAGPVLFEPSAAAQLFAQVLGDGLKITRRPVPQPGRPVPYSPSEWEGRAGSRVLPEWMDVVDDPTQKEWHGRSLAGAYAYDDEGVRAEPLSLIEKGVLKTFLLTRTPVRKDLAMSNGHARLHGMFGAAAPAFGNLFVHASGAVSAAALKQRLIGLAKERQKPYGLLVRKLDYPSSASFDEFRRMAAELAQSGGGSRLASLPLLVYRVYPDGREELVRGLRFRGLSPRSLKDIVAASDDSAVFNFLDSFAPLALMGGSPWVCLSSSIAPGVLFDELELDRAGDETPKLPIVPPPLLSFSR